METHDKARRNVCHACHLARPGVEWDARVRLRLCAECWAAIDPRDHNVSDPEFLTEDEKRR